MKKNLFLLLFSIVIFTSSFGIYANTQDSETSLKAPDFKQLNATQLVSAMGAGWNLGNQLEAMSSEGVPNETAWGNPKITPALIQSIKEAGFDSIRIPISYLKNIGSAPNYTVDPAWLTRIKEVVDYAYSQEMYIIINMHGDGYHTVPGAWLFCDSSDQKTIKEKYQKVWQQIANIFVDYDDHLIFESMNEEFDGSYGTPNTTYYSNLNTYNQIFVDTVRQTGGNNSARWLLVPGWNTNIDYTAGNYGFVIPTDTYRSSTIPSSEKRIAISVHYYSPWEFCGDSNQTNITQWGATATNSDKKASWGQEDYLVSQFKLMHNKFVTQGYPFVVGEYGSIDKTNDDSTNNIYRAIFAKTVCSTAKKYGGVPIYWDNGHNGSYGFGLINRTTHAITQKGIIDAILSGIGEVIYPDSTITPITAKFDKKITEQTDIVVTMILNGNTLREIKNGTEVLLPGTDYTISDTTVTIMKNYLAKLAIGTTNLTFNFSAGIDPVLYVNIIDSSDQLSSLKIQEYNGNTSDKSNTLNPIIKLINTGATAINLSNVKIHYYYTADNEKSQNFTCDWSTVGANNVTGTCVKMPVSKTGADYYLQIGFGSEAGSISAGQSIELYCRINKTDWSTYTQTGDYSFNTTSTTYNDWNKITAYISGALKWGIEP